jgi:hypothetical protein
LSNRLKTIGLDETTMLYVEDVLKTGEKAIIQIREKYFKD